MYRYIVLCLLLLLAMQTHADEPKWLPAQEELHSSESCWQHLVKRHAYLEMNRAALQQEIKEHQDLVELALVYRAESVAVAQRLKWKIKKRKPLSGKDLDILNQGTLSHLELRDKLFAIAELHECWIDMDAEILKHYQISSEMRLKAVMLSLSAAFVLYDNYLLAVAIFEEDKKLRRFLNSRDSGYGKGRAELNKVTLQYNSFRNQRRIKSALNFYEEQLQVLGGELLQQEDAAYLHLLISQSPTYHMTLTQSPLSVFGRKVKFLGSVTTDSLNGLSAEGMNIFSMIFGNSIGLIEFRKGKLYKNRKVKRQLKRELQAGDILLEKTPFRLTDKFIPGHWGHAAIWIGTKDELQDLGIWDHPLVQQYHKEIRKRHSIVEALRGGVQLSSLDQFMNIDDIAVIRAGEMTREQKAESIIRALRQVGKAYDFNFDVETTNRIVCSELIYVVYTDIEWPTKKTLGRATISPDQVAVKALNGNPLQLVALYHDGKLVKHNPLERMAALVKAK